MSVCLCVHINEVAEIYEIVAAVKTPHDSQMNLRNTEFSRQTQSLTASAYQCHNKASKASKQFDILYMKISFTLIEFV